MLPTVVDSCGRRRRTRPRCRARRRSPALVGDQQASLARSGRACAPGDAKITFGTGGMLDIVPRRRAARRSRRAASGGTFPIVAWRIGGADTWGARGDHARRRARTWSGCATTSGSSRARDESARGRGAVRRHRRRRVRARAARARHARSGTTARAAPSSGSPAAPVGPSSCGRCSKASRTAAPTSSRRPRPTPASPIDVLRIDGGMTRQPDVRAGARRRDADAGRGVAGEGGDHARRRRSSPASRVGTWPDLDALAGTWKPAHPRTSRSGRSTGTAGSEACRPGPPLDPGALHRRLLTCIAALGAFGAGQLGFTARCGAGYRVHTPLTLDWCHDHRGPGRRGSSDRPPDRTPGLRRQPGRTRRCARDASWCVRPTPCAASSRRPASSASAARTSPATSTSRATSSPCSTLRAPAARAAPQPRSSGSTRCGSSAPRGLKPLPAAAGGGAPPRPAPLARHATRRRSRTTTTSRTTSTGSCSARR